MAGGEVYNAIVTMDLQDLGVEQKMSSALSGVEQQIQALAATAGVQLGGGLFDALGQGATNTAVGIEKLRGLLGPLQQEAQRLQSIGAPTSLIAGLNQAAMAAEALMLRMAQLQGMRGNTALPVSIAQAEARVLAQAQANPVRAIDSRPASEQTVQGTVVPTNGSNGSRRTPPPFGESAGVAEQAETRLRHINQLLGNTALSGKLLEDALIQLGNVTREEARQLITASRGAPALNGSGEKEKIRGRDVEPGVRQEIAGANPEGGLTKVDEAQAGLVRAYSALELAIKASYETELEATKAIAASIKSLIAADRALEGAKADEALAHELNSRRVAAGAIDTSLVDQTAAANVQLLQYKQAEAEQALRQLEAATAGTVAEEELTLARIRAAVAADRVAAATTVVPSFPGSQSGVTPGAGTIVDEKRLGREQAEARLTVAEDKLYASTEARTAALSAATKSLLGADRLLTDAIAAEAAAHEQATRRAAAGPIDLSIVDRTASANVQNLQLTQAKAIQLEAQLKAATAGTVAAEELLAAEIATLRAQERVTAAINAEQKRAEAASTPPGRGGFFGALGGNRSEGGGLLAQAGTAAKYFAFYQAFSLVDQGLRSIVDHTREYSLAINQLSLAMGISYDAAGEMGRQYANIAQDNGASPQTGVEAAVQYTRAFQDTSGASALIGAKVGSTISLLESTGDKQKDFETTSKRLDDLIAISKNYGLGAGGSSATYDAATSIGQSYGMRSGGDLLSGTAQIADLLKESGYTKEQGLSLIAGVMQRTGGSSDVAAGDLKRFLGRQGQATFSNIFQQYGIDTNQPLEEELRQLAEQYKTLNEHQRTSIVSRLGGGRAGAAVSAALDDYDKQQETAKKAEDSQGLASSQAQARMETLAGTIQRIDAAWSSFAVSLGKSGIGTELGIVLREVAPLLNGLTALTNGWAQLSPKIAGVNIPLKQIVETMGLLLIASKAFTGSFNPTGMFQAIGRKGAGARLAGEAPAAAGAATESATGSSSTAATAAEEQQAAAATAVAETSTAAATAQERLVAVQAQATAAAAAEAEATALLATAQETSAATASVGGRAQVEASVASAAAAKEAAVATTEQTQANLAAAAAAHEVAAAEAEAAVAAQAQAVAAQELAVAETEAAVAAAAEGAGLAAGLIGLAGAAASAAITLAPLAAIIAGFIAIGGAQDARDTNDRTWLGMKSGLEAAGAAGDDPQKQADAEAALKTSLADAEKNKGWKANLNTGYQALRTDFGSAWSAGFGDKDALAKLYGEMAQNSDTVPANLEQQKKTKAEIADLQAKRIAEQWRQRQLTEQIHAGGPLDAKTAFGEDYSNVSGGLDQIKAQNLSVDRSKTLLTDLLKNMPAADASVAFAPGQGLTGIGDEVQRMLTNVGKMMDPIKQLAELKKVSGLIGPLQEAANATGAADTIQTAKDITENIITVTDQGILANVKARIDNIKALQKDNARSRQQISAVLTGGLEQVAKNGDINSVVALLGQADKKFIDDFNRIQEGKRRILEDALASLDAAVAAANAAAVQVHSIGAGGEEFQHGSRTPTAAQAAAEAAAQKKQAELDGVKKIQDSIKAAMPIAAPSGSAFTPGKAAVDADALAIAKMQAQVIPGDPVSAAAIGIDVAKYQMAHAGGDMVKYYTALKALHDQQYAYAQAVSSASAAEAQLAAIPGDPISTARANLAAAEIALGSAVKGTADYYAKLKSVQDGKYALAQSEAEKANNAALLNIDMTDPVAQANAKYQAAVRKLNADRARGADTTADEVAVRQTKSDRDKSKWDQDFADHQTNYNLNRTSLSSYMSYLQSQHDYLTAVKNKTRTQVDELNQVDQALKSLTDSMDGQFNLGNIKVPTPYEVRRSIAGGGAGAASSTTSNVTITINGTDLQAVRGVIAQYVGQAATQTTGTTTRKV